MPRKPNTLQDMKDNPVIVTTKIPRNLRDDMKKAARIDNRSSSSFVAEAIRERIKLFLEDDINSRDYLPPGLRR